MGCTGCANTIQKKLSEVAGVTAVTVDFATKKATVETDREIPFEALEKALEGTHYSIHQSSNSEGSGVFYCPMHCEGDKTYDHPGDCPICGMDLVEQVGGAQQHHHHQESPKKVKGNGVFYCPMHCEGDKTYDHPGDCPVCGMDLVEQVSTEVAFSPSGEQGQNRKLRRHFWGAVAFTLPIFIIAMSGMWHNNPLYELMPISAWNWVQFALSLPVVFYFC